VTAIALSTTRSSLLAPLPLSAGRSPAAGHVDDRVGEVCRHLLQPVTFTRAFSNGMVRLNAEAAAALVRGWDGYDADPIDAKAYHHAQYFLSLLPTLTPVPEVSIDPDGEVSFSWDLDRDWVLSVSVGADGRLSYAGLFGSSKTYGTEWLGSEIPATILGNITRLYAGYRASGR
jgi:hypothetical protein